MLLTTAAAWSIGARGAQETAGQAPAQWSGSSAGARGTPGPVVLPFRRIPAAVAARATATTDGRDTA